jgi:hypothetical protein
MRTRGYIFLGKKKIIMWKCICFVVFSFLSVFCLAYTGMVVYLAILRRGCCCFVTVAFALFNKIQRIQSIVLLHNIIDCALIVVILPCTPMVNA